MALPDDTVLLYDGTCGFCAVSVQFVLHHERRRRTLRFATLEGSTGTKLRRQHPELTGVDSIVLAVPDGGGGQRLLVRSDAALAVAFYLGGIWRMVGALGRIVPHRARDEVYDAIARRRQRIVQLNDRCLNPTVEQRGRFL
jgi:predicted DCC family thiol-disulfide oxidoreductase YuxK